MLVGSGTPGPVVAVPVATQRTILRTRDLIPETQKTLSITGALNDAWTVVFRGVFSKKAQVLSLSLAAVVVQ